MINSSNKIKADLLGMPYGTANNKLRKALLFDCAKRLNEDRCFRCGIKIETIEEFSIEHKNAWARQDDPIDAFFDLGNRAAYLVMKQHSDRYSKRLKSKRERYHRNRGSVAQ